MASRSRTRRRSGKSPTDWVVTVPAWDGLNVIPQGTTDLLPLTQHASQADPLLRAVPQVEQSVVAVRGQLIFFPSAPVAANGRGTLDLRLIVADSDLGGTPGVVVGYDLRSTTWADQQFLWHRTFLFPAGGTWLEPEKRQVMLNVDVNVKVRRRLEPMQVLVLAIGWAQGNLTAVPDLEYYTRLRTLVKYMTAGG